MGFVFRRMMERNFDRRVVTKLGGGSGSDDERDSSLKAASRGGWSVMTTEEDDGESRLEVVGGVANESATSSETNIAVAMTAAAVFNSSELLTMIPP